MTPIQFTIAGIPKGQPRHRSAAVFSRRQNRHVARTYPSDVAAAWQMAVRLACRKHLPASPLKGPLYVGIDLFLPRPKTLQKARALPACVCYAAIKPDRDNGEKLILDIMTQEGWWEDDAQVCDGPVRKFHGPVGTAPCAFVTVRCLPLIPAGVQQPTR